jgi:hypothetical protein
VLRALFLDWQRGDRELDTVSLNAPLRQGEDSGVLGDVLAAPEAESAEEAADGRFAGLWTSLEPEERLDLKLLSLLEHDLSPEDLRLLADVSERPLDATLDLVTEVQTELRRKDARLSQLGDELDSAWGWLALRRRELQETEEKLRLMEPGQETSESRRLVERKAELEMAIAKRSRQHTRALEEVRTFKVTTPYKDIARLRNSTVGTVCSRIFRLRQRLEAQWQAREATP